MNKSISDLGERIVYDWLLQASIVEFLCKSFRHVKYNGVELCLNWLHPAKDISPALLMETVDVSLRVSWGAESSLPLMKRRAR